MSLNVTAQTGRLEVPQTDRASACVSQEIFWWGQARGRGRPVKTFLSAKLAAWHTVCAYEVPKKLGMERWEPVRWDRRRIWPSRNTSVPHVTCSLPNLVALGQTLRAYLQRSTGKICPLCPAVQGHKHHCHRHGLVGYLWLPVSVS